MRVMTRGFPSAAGGAAAAPGVVEAGGAEAEGVALAAGVASCGFVTVKKYQRDSSFPKRCVSFGATCTGFSAPNTKGSLAPGLLVSGVTVLERMSGETAK